MNKLIKHIIITLAMLALVAAVALLPKNEGTSMLMVKVWGLIAFILLGTVAYVIYGRKKGLFCILLMGLIVGVSGKALAQAELQIPENEEDATYNIKELLDSSSNGQDWCQAAKNFDVDKAIKDNKNPIKDDPKISKAVTEANQYGYAYDMAKAKQRKETWDQEAGTYDSALECAQQLLNKVAEFSLKSDEMAASTVYQVLSKDKGTCWPCGIANLVLGITEKISLAIEDDLREAALGLLGIMLLFWILYRVTVLIGQWGTANISEFFTEFLRRMIIAMIAAIILASSANLHSVYSNILSPFIDATSKLAQEFGDMSVSPNGKSMAVKIGTQADLLQCDCCASGSSSDCNKGMVTDFKDGEGSINIIEKESKRELMCMTCSVYKQTAPMVAIGRVLTYRSTHVGFWDRAVRGAVGFTVGLFAGAPLTIAAIAAYCPNPIGMWFVGITLIIVFTILSYLISFKLMDIFLRLGFVLFLTPFLIVTFVFPGTRSYTQRGWNFLVNAMLNILALSIGVAFILACYQETLPAYTVNQLSDLVAKTGDPSNDYAEKLYNALIGEDGGAFSTTFILIVFLFFGMKILDASRIVIETLSDTSSGIPAIAGAAVVGAIRTAVAPLRLGIAAALDRAQAPDIIKNRFKKDEDEDQNDKKPGVFSKTGKWMGEKAGNAAGNIVEKTQRQVGECESGMGKKMTELGTRMTPAFYGLGSIIGVALAVAGGALTTKGETMKATAKATGESVKKATKESFEETGKDLQKRWNKMKRKIKKRIKQIPANIKKKLKQGLMKIIEAPKHLKNTLKKKYRRQKANNKYRRHAPSFKKFALESAESGLDHSLNEADKAVENTNE